MVQLLMRVIEPQRVFVRRERVLLRSDKVKLIVVPACVRWA